VAQPGKRVSAPGQDEVQHDHADQSAVDSDRDELGERDPEVGGGLGDRGVGTDRAIGGQDNSHRDRPAESESLPGTESGRRGHLIHG
jgi:hypothetical protein